MALFLLGAPLLLYIGKNIGRRLEDNSFRATTKETGGRQALETTGNIGQDPVAVDDGKRWK